MPVGGGTLGLPRRHDVKPVPAMSVRIADLLLWITALVGAALLALTVWAMSMGMRPLVVMSASMEPAIPTGSVVLVDEVSHEDLRVGDVVAPWSPEGARVLHRIVAIRDLGSTSRIKLKGDANRTPDLGHTEIAEAMRVQTVVPGAGWIAAHLRSPFVGFVGAVILLAPFALARRREPAASAPSR